jgi:nucleotide-binding universal stress UspA family protein
MNRALVVVEDTDAHRALLREASELAAGTGADLVLLSLEARDEVDESTEQFARTEGVSVVEMIIEDARESIAAVAGEALSDLDVAYETMAAVTEPDERADEIIATAGQTDCDHVFLVGQERSPTGKAIFGDVAQAVVLNFGGSVTTLTA